MNVFCLGSDQIAGLWPRFAHHIERFSDYLDRDVRADLIDAQLQLWGLQDGEDVAGVAVTGITGRTCEVVGAAGAASHEEMRRLHTEIETWARSIGCSRMRIYGRKGWVRLLGYRQTGLSATGIVAEKEL